MKGVKWELVALCIILAVGTPGGYLAQFSSGTIRFVGFALLGIAVILALGLVLTGPSYKSEQSLRKRNTRTKR
jgi:hypothetical protein